jgi:antitoxin (DNA-binding transcriptional repressor) of toxin-antitoxin stability system
MPLARAQYPASCMVGDDALIYTVRELARQATRIISEIENSGKPAFITRYGRFIATIMPLAPGQVESQALPEMARQLAKRNRHQPPSAVAERTRRRTA